MDQREKILSEAYTLIARVQGEIIGDLYVRHSLSKRRVVSYRAALLQIAQKLEKLEQLLSSFGQPTKD